MASMSCSKCSRKLLRGISSFNCTACYNPNTVALIIYRAELDVSDTGNTAVFVAFDTDMTKLTNTSASDAAAITTPKIITAIVGKTFTFQIKVTEYNFTSNHQAFTISRIYETKDALPTATFDNQVVATGPAIDDIPPAVENPEENRETPDGELPDGGSTVTPQ
ncbi:unnamed protein product [Microthlaspi erraticum]|uniref:Replication factor A C-terminal domain-containing protein n=1 Tax=Microthlaspi erraticum TaxID=1685480 RepID=A0A6D2HV58_9BRAS|nr:unnamed protein product [Microthlaspi erraticum]